MRFRPGWVAAGLAVAVLCIPVGVALAPGPSDPALPSPQEPTASADPFQPDVQLAARTIADPQIDELSGLAASRLHPGVLYGINDSGGGAVVYAIDQTGATVATLTLAGAKNQDWEAIAPGWDADGTPVLWIGDTGINTKRRDVVNLVKFSEPEQLADQEVAWKSYPISYPDGAHDAETVLVDPRDGTISIVTKGSGDPGGWYQAPRRLRTDATNKLEWVASAPTGVTDGAWELSAAGDPRLVLVGYFQIHLQTADGWKSSFGPLQLQREAVAWPWLPSRVPNELIFLGSEGSESEIITTDVP